MASSSIAKLLLLLTLLMFLAHRAHRVAALVPNSYGPSPLAKWQERVMRQRMMMCYQDIDSGLWGEGCKASVIDKENCALKCISRPCYDFVYGEDSLEEGELDIRRGREFRFCVRRSERAEKEAKDRE